MDSYEIQKTGERRFTVTVFSPKNLRWRPLDSTGICILSNRTSDSSNGMEYAWELEVKKPGRYEFKMMHQGKDGVFRKLIIPVIASK